jgi:hypothetical protein
MAPDDMPAEATQAELAALGASFGVMAVRTDETYDSLVRSAQVLSDARHEHLADTTSYEHGRGGPPPPTSDRTVRMRHVW